MIRKVQRAAIAVCASVAMLPVPAWSQLSLERLKTDYQTTSAQLQEHLFQGQWIDEDPRSPALLARQWSLAGQWVAAWLDSHPLSGSDGVKAAVTELAPSETPHYLALNATTFLVVAPGPIGNVFIVAKSGDRYRPAWSTAQPQQASGKQANILAA